MHKVFPHEFGHDAAYAAFFLAWKAFFGAVMCWAAIYTTGTSCICARISELIRCNRRPLEYLPARGR